MEDLKNDINYVSSDIKKYVESEVQLGKLELIDQISSFSASVFSHAVLVMLGIVSYLMLLFSLGLFLNQFFTEAWMGFSVAFGISLFIILVGTAFNRYILEGPIQDFIISKLAKRLLS